MADKALLVGINDYRTATPLRGCHNDVDNMFALLTGTFGFEPGRVNRLRGADVTRAELLTRMNWLLTGVNPGDRLVFHFSGHGSYTHDRSGDEHDRLDELICLWDYPAAYLLDDDLWDWTRRCPAGARLTVVLDTCHSGTGTRVFNDLRDDPGDVVTSEDGWDDPAFPRPVAPRWAEPLAIDVADRTATAATRSARSEADMNHLLLAAARDDQQSGDGRIAGAYHGVFTYYLCAVARHYQGRATYRQHIDVVNLNLRRKGYEQVPQLEGPSAEKDRTLFG